MVVLKEQDLLFHSRVGYLIATLHQLIVAFQLLKTFLIGDSAPLALHLEVLHHMFVILAVFPVLSFRLDQLH